MFGGRRKGEGEERVVTGEGLVLFLLGSRQKSVVLRRVDKLECLLENRIVEIVDFKIGGIVVNIPSYQSFYDH